MASIYQQDSLLHTRVYALTLDSGVPLPAVCCSSTPLAAQRAVGLLSLCVHVFLRVGVITVCLGRVQQAQRARSSALSHMQRSTLRTCACENVSWVRWWRAVPRCVGGGGELLHLGGRRGAANACACPGCPKAVLLGAAAFSY